MDAARASAGAAAATGAAAAPRAATAIVVALVSAATLAFEILLVRLFAIEHFHHFATMAIGVAMLGTGAGGTLVAVAAPMEPGAAARRLAGAALGAAAALLAVPALAQRVVLDPTQLAWNPAEWPKLALLYVLLATPFLFGALVTLLALVGAGARPGLIYGAGFAGAGLGAAAAFAVLGAVTPARALTLPALLASGAAVLAARAPRAGAPRSAAVLRWTAWVLIAAAVGTGVRPLCVLRVTPYKALAQLDAHPGARRLEERTSAMGWVVTVASPAFRYAPGLSLAYEDAVPREVALCVDGDVRGATADWRQLRDPAAFFGALPSSLPFALGGRERVLVPRAGGGLEAPAAVALGAREVVAVEPDPRIVALARGTLPRPRAGFARLDWRTDPARGLARTDPARFDLVSIGPEGGLGASAGGLRALEEDYVHTVEGYAAWLGCLRPGGVLAVTRWLEVPPRSAPRAILTAAAALRRLGHEPGPALVVARGWSTATVLARPSGFGRGDLERIEEWCRARGFVLDWSAGREAGADVSGDADPAGLGKASRAAAAGGAAARRLADAGPFDLGPASDARPFAHHYVRLSRLRDLVGGDRGAALPFAEWGPVAMAATLVQSGAAALVLLALPLARRPARRRDPGEPATARVAAFFAAIGCGYMAAEIATIHQLGLLLGDPVRAVGVTLVTLLVASGLGSVFSDRIAPPRARPAFAILAAALAAIAAAGPPAAGALIGLPLATRIEFAVVPLAALGFAMGIPFPAGLRGLAGTDPRRIAWAWAANGFASVVAVPLAALLALESGIPALGFSAAACYLAAAVLLRAAPRGGGPL